MTQKNKGQVPDTKYPTILSATVNPTASEVALRSDAKAFYPVDNELAKKYCAQNRMVYFVVINTWYSLLTDYCGTEIPEFSSQLRSGLLPLIAAAQDVSDAIIKETPLPVNLFTYILRERLALTDPTGESIRLALQCLRYPKRFSPYVTDALEDTVLTEFRNRNNRAKMLNRKEIPYWLATQLRQVVAEVLQPYGVVHAMTEYASAAALPKGATAEGAHTLVEKMSAIESEEPLFFYPYNVSKIQDSSSSVRWCNVVTVPKSYKTRRVIAEEQCYRQVGMYPFFERIDYCLQHSTGKYGTAGRVTLHDQTRNQKLAQYGSVTGELATVDLSAASDSVTASLVRTIFPSDIVRQWDEWRSEYAMIKGKLCQLHLYSTMGSRLTFGIESIVFWAIACVAVETAARMLNLPFTADEISVYGDDCIVPSWAYDTFVDFLEMCGFIVNHDKSFNDGYYRESCGCEYYAGYEVSSKYYPRSPIAIHPDGDTVDVTPDALTQLIALQHRLYSHRKANAFLTELILHVQPDMTYSSPGSEYTDLWSEYISPMSRPVPLYAISHKYDKLGREIDTKCKKIGDHPEILREYHYVLTTHYNKTEKWEDAQRLAYIQFLHEGPYYASPLDELLGVSSPRDWKAASSRGTSKLVRKLT